MATVASAPLLSAEEVEKHCAASASQLEQLKQIVRDCGSVLVAFSGGVDSTFVLKVAVDELGTRALGLTALSPSVSPDEADEARALAASVGAQHLVVDSHELEDPRYAANPTNRCYFCKTELYAITERVRAERQLGVVLDGFNADDTRDHRPGHQAARERKVRSPLSEVGLTKLQIRAWSQRLGLPTWDKPQMACLASRGGAEKAVRALGFKHFRVRYHQDVARLEVSAEELPRLFDPETRRQVDLAIKAHGFTFVAVDLEPFRSGRMNDGVKAEMASREVVKDGGSVTAVVP
jgi:pyridinium-3,5-biscarboxylic acid mononucleotide sulfurtransferase